MSSGKKIDFISQYLQKANVQMKSPKRRLIRAESSPDNIPQTIKNNPIHILKKERETFSK